MFDNPLVDIDIKILEEISAYTDGELKSETFGLSCRHSSGSVRWVQMDARTSALICEFDSCSNRLFKIPKLSGHTYFHALFIESGNLEIHNIGFNEVLGLMPREVLFFQNMKRDIQVQCAGNGRCRFVLISCLSPFFKRPASDQCHETMELIEVDHSLAFNLQKVLHLSADPNDSYKLKGSLFTVLGSSLPNRFKEFNFKPSRKDLDNRPYSEGVQ